MANFPHQFNNLEKLYNSLQVIQEIINKKLPIKDEIFGELLTRKGIYTYRNKDLSIDEFLENELTKPKSNRGYLTVSRDIRRLFELLGFVELSEDKLGKLSKEAIQLLSTKDEAEKLELWRRAFLQLSIESNQGKYFHPYRYLILLVQNYSQLGIDTNKLMLALEADDDSPEEQERILKLSELSLEQIISETGTSASMVRNSVKILPAVAEQLGDIVRVKNKSFAVNEVIINEDEISTVPLKNKTKSDYQKYRKVTAETVAKNPDFNDVSSTSVDYADSIKIRQKRHADHQEIVRDLATLCEKHTLTLYEGQFDLLSVNSDSNLLFEVKTIKDSKSDQEKQVVKGLGQLKLYKHSIVEKEMSLKDTSLFMVFSRKPLEEYIAFLESENVNVVWVENNSFLINNNGNAVSFNPTKKIES